VLGLPAAPLEPAIGRGADVDTGADAGATAGRGGATGTACIVRMFRVASFAP